MGIDKEITSDDKPNSTTSNTYNFHDHCVKCFKFLKCEETQCPINHCQFNCGLILHSCKQDEHNLICIKKPTNCINAFHGCLYIGSRISMLTHLKVCPASIVRCGRTWNRLPLYSKSRSNSALFKQPNPPVTYNDISMRLAHHDQQQVIERYKQLLAKGKKNLAKREGHSQLSQQSIDLLKQLLDGNSIDGEPTKLSKQLHGSVDFDSMPFFNQEEATDDYLSQAERAVNGIEPFPGEYNSSCNLNTSTFWPVIIGLKIDIEWLSPFNQRESSYRFECGHIMRRDQFSHHAKMIHDIVDGYLEGWLIHRCPLSQYGCGFSEERLCPSSPLSKFIFSDTNGCISLTSNQQVIGKRNPRSIFCLPEIVLQLIFSKLDNHSFRNLSLTSRKMRMICEELVYTNGVVEGKWEKKIYENNRFSWQITKKVWYYTTSFASNDKLDWNNRLSSQHSLGEHLKNCPFLQPNIRTEPVKLINMLK